MDPNERKGWTEIVTADDLDGHMAEIGQAGANAGLIQRMFREYPLGGHGLLWVPGCGTGQMLEYMDPSELGAAHITFTDLNAGYLERVAARMDRRVWARYSVSTDDLEETAVMGEYDGTLTVLVLQHIGWVKGVEQLLTVNPQRMYFIIQEQANDKNPVTEERELRPSIAEFSKIARGRLVPRGHLADFLFTRDYKLHMTYETSVPDEKTMVGMVFEKG